MHYEVAIRQEFGLFAIQPVVSVEPWERKLLEATRLPPLRLGRKRVPVRHLLNGLEQMHAVRIRSLEQAKVEVSSLREQLRDLARTLGSLAAAKEPSARSAPSPLSETLLKAITAGYQQVLGDFGIEACPSAAEPGALTQGAAIRLHGPVEGYVGLAAGPETARQVHLAMTGEDLPAGDPEHAATLGELVNMVTGWSVVRLAAKGVRAKLPEPGVPGVETHGQEPAQQTLTGPCGPLVAMCAVRKAA